ncbi:MAG: DUF2249 domain-containing protein [Bradyrhizobium sp.]|uniref:DUF2249 domain-containing protein n=1 Tax=unclassified Bradyrhizobium TaxID=2631580 RepID=UPI0007092404|nr:hypothetical protein ASG57_33935 [Bradyrhizobium sp. Leaf396]
MTQYLDLDVRPILRGGEPFSLIMAALEGLEVGQGLRLYAPFKPVPLFAVMSEKGLPTPTASSTERIGKCCSHLSEQRRTPDLAPERTRTSPPGPSLSWSSTTATSPLPREPVFLFSQLEKRGFRHDGTTYELTVRAPS